MEDSSNVVLVSSSPHDDSINSVQTKGDSELEIIGEALHEILGDVFPEAFKKAPATTTLTTIGVVDGALRDGAEGAFREGVIGLFGGYLLDQTSTQN